jgi:heme o synthase
LGVGGIVYLIGATVLGIWFLYESISMARSRTVQKARRLLMVSVLYLPLIFGLLVLDH